MLFIKIVTAFTSCKFKKIELHLLAQKRDFSIFLEVRTIKLIRDKEPSDWQGHFFIFLLFLKEFQVLWDFLAWMLDSYWQFYAEHTLCHLLINKIFFLSLWQQLK